MAWTSTGRDLPGDWKTRTRQVKDRDGWRCTWTTDGQRCTETTRLEVDHIGNPNNHHLDNLRTLCHYHHAKRTALQAAAARKLPPRNRTPEPHPGLIAPPSSTWGGPPPPAPRPSGQG